MRVFRKTLAVAFAALVTLVVVGVTPAQAHTPTVTLYCQYQVIATDGLFVRQDHDISSPALRWMPYGTLVTGGADGTVTSGGYTWRQVTYSGAFGWSAANYLSRTSAPCFS